MSGALTDACAVVTGAGQGIGRAIAELFASEGATVIVAERDVATGSEAAEAIVQTGQAAHFVETDVSDPDSATRLASEAKRYCGRIDVLVNNAGLGGVSSLPDIDDAQWRAMIDVNLRGVFLVSRFVLPSMLAEGKGSIVNIASIYGLVADPNTSAYAASKGGLVMLTRAMAVDYASAGIRVNAVCPGFVSGPMADRDHTPEELAVFAARHPIGRLAAPQEIAQSALFLASSASSFVTGSCLIADGGYLAA